MRQLEYKIFRKGIYYTLSFILVLWAVKSIEWSQDVDLGHYGIFPRTIKGSLGIITAPLIHGDIFHLFSNTLPLIVLGIGLFYFYHKIAAEVVFWIYLASGFWVWIIGRDAYHIGASGLVYGILAFLFFGGLLRKNSRSLAISMVVFFMYGSMIYGLFPGDENVSWESHLMGTMAGAFCAVYFRKYPIHTGKGQKLLAWDNEDINVGEERAINHTADSGTEFVYRVKSKDNLSDNSET
ncbi:rhomboid family intramembrane serine protease [Bacteroidota bacterium]